jgi:hypothetical protein
MKDRSVSERQHEAADDYQSIVRWIPIVLPLLAVAVVCGVYFIDWAVLGRVAM